MVFAFVILVCIHTKNNSNIFILSWSTDDKVLFSYSDTELYVVSWSIDASNFLPLDTVSLRMSRLGASDANDTLLTGMNFFTAYLIQD